MLLIAKRKNHLSEFSFQTKLPTALLLALLFFMGFWIVHLYLTGCPNCVNVRCPLNSEAKKTKE